MIKRDESDVVNIEFELQTKMFSIVLSFEELIIHLQPVVRLTWGLDQNVAFKMDKCFILKKQMKIADMWLILLDKLHKT